MHGSGLGIFRYVAEQTLALLHQFRRLRTRFDKRDDIHEAFMDLGCSMICWRRFHRSNPHGSIKITALAPISKRRDFFGG
jgi:hypothetical protein